MESWYCETEGVAVCGSSCAVRLGSGRLKFGEAGEVAVVG